MTKGRSHVSSCCSTACLPACSAVPGSISSRNGSRRGPHELAVRAVDAAGNEGASTIQRISIVHSIPLTPTIGTVEIDALSDGWLRVTAAADPRGGQLTVVAGSDVITAPITSDATTVFVPTGAEALGAATLWGVPDRG